MVLLSKNSKPFSSFKLTMGMGMGIGDGDWGCQADSKSYYRLDMFRLRVGILKYGFGQ
jgi:hypothetical protein